MPGPDEVVQSKAGQIAGSSWIAMLGYVVREPLIHFVVAGALIFGGYAWWSPTPPVAADGPIRIGQGEIGWLRETFSSQWRRDPTDEDMKLLIDTLVREQLLAREARALGLDRDDTIIRRRLAQKLLFLVEDTVRIGDPDERELRRFLEANAARYRSAPTLSFQHVFYSPKRRTNAAEEARLALAWAMETASPEGDPLPLESVYAQVDPAAIASLFGPDFAEALVGLQPGAWSGPVKSAYGVHLVRVTDRVEGKPRALEEVRQALLDDWLRQTARAASEAFMDKLREKYGVVIDAGAGAVPLPKSVASVAP